NDKGFLTLPKAFKGYIIIELSNKNLQNDLCNCEWDFKRVERFQVAFDGNKEVINQPIYIDGFYLDYNQDEQVKAWDFANLTKRSDYRKGLLPWYGEFVGKHLTGLTLGYRVCPCESTRNAIFEIVNALADAQWADGYIGVYNGCSRYSQFIDNWDVWNHYHAIIGLIECHKIFKDDLSFKVAKRALDCIYKTFKKTSYLLVGGKETNRSIAHAYAEFYTISRERRYLLESERIIKEECQEENGWYKTALNDGEFYTSSLKRWEVLHTILTLGTLYREVKNPEYLKVLKRVWQSLYNLDVHNTGGFSTNEGATGNPYSDGVIETCCSIAWMALTNELFQCEKSVEVADAFEVSYYNALLGALTTGEVYCTYNTPMNIIDGTSGIFDGRRVPSQVDSAFQYTKGAPQMNCCQANIARGLGELGRWAHYCDKENNIYLNFLGKAEVKVNVCGKEIVIIQDSNYPCGQSIKFTVKAKDAGSKFSLNIRIPSWSNGAEVIIDNQKLIGKAGSYLKIDKRWGKKEEILMNLNFDIRVVKGEKEQAEYSSVYCGPVLLALEEDINSGIGRNEEILSSSLCKENLLDASAQNGFISLKAKRANGQEVLLKDFARVGKCKKGKYTPYWSWIKVID
ncbi:MAG: glycoside hydrolase family 127 protein, partial [Clostridia bacterium]|nr:glycoside hydrolase family 127 protein [Clostridia bacterium]